MAAAILTFPCRMRSRLNCLHCTDAVRCSICTRCVDFQRWYIKVIGVFCCHCTLGFILKSFVFALIDFPRTLKCAEAFFISDYPSFTRLGKGGTWHQCGGSGLSTRRDSFPYYGHLLLTTMFTLDLVSVFCCRFYLCSHFGVPHGWLFET